MTADSNVAGKAAIRLLLGQHLLSLHIDVTRLHYDKTIIFDSMQHYCKLTTTSLGSLFHGSDCLRDGCTLIRHRKDGVFYIVLYNGDTANTGRRNFTLAHEVGHIFLAHETDGDSQEREANQFAASLLAPDVLVHALAQLVPGRLTPEVVSSVFFISLQAAENRICELARRPSIPFLPEELLLLQKNRHLLTRYDEPLVDL